LIGTIFNCLLKEIVVGEVVLLAVSKIRFCDISDSQKMIDTGFRDTEEINNIFLKFGIKNDDLVIVLTFERL
jgi:hypothetical protein